jgi:hypothetical protein
MNTHTTKLYLCTETYQTFGSRMSGQECPLQHIQIYGFVFHRWLQRTFQMNNAAHIMPNRIYHGTIRIPKPKSINTTSQFDWDGSSEAPVLGSFRRIIMLDVVKSPCTISASCATVTIKYWLVEMKYHGKVIILRAFFQ